MPSSFQHNPRYFLIAVLATVAVLIAVFAAWEWYFSYKKTSTIPSAAYQYKNQPATSSASVLSPSPAPPMKDSDLAAFIKNSTVPTSLNVHALTQTQ